jgi:hypothetical protein
MVKSKMTRYTNENIIFGIITTFYWVYSYSDFTNIFIQIIYKIENATGKFSLISDNTVS